MEVESNPSPPEQAGSEPAPARNGGRAAGMSLLTRFLTLREGSIIVVTVVTIAYFAITVNHFFTYGNFKNLLPYFCFLAIMAAGQVFVMTLGEIDLSIGALYLITPIAFWKLSGAGIPLIPSVILSLVIAVAFRAINRLFVAWGRDPSVVATLVLM